MTPPAQSESESAAGADDAMRYIGPELVIDIRDDTDGTAVAASVLASVAEADDSELLARSEELFLATNGAFDPFTDPGHRGPTSYSDGVASAWAVGRAAELLAERGCQNYCVAAGGHIVMSGRRSATKPWRAGIRNPLSSRTLTTAIASGSGLVAVATSHPFRGLSQVIDMSWPERRSELAGVTVTGPDIASAHAFASALFVKGLDGLNWISQFHGFDAHVVTQHNAAHWTPGFKKYWSVG